MHHSTLRLGLFAACCALLLPGHGLAQQQVYRCESGGKVSYSHAPCLNAQAIDTTPTQGLNSMTGKRRPSAEVQRSEQQRAFAEAVYPLTRMSPATHAREARRYKLLPEDRAHCSLLDLRLPRLERDAREALPRHKAASEQALLQERQRFYELRC